MHNYARIFFVAGEVILILCYIRHCFWYVTILACIHSFSKHNAMNCTRFKARNSEKLGLQCLRSWVCNVKNSAADVQIIRDFDLVGEFRLLPEFYSRNPMASVCHKTTSMSYRSNSEISILFVCLICQTKIFVIFLSILGMHQQQIKSNRFFVECSDKLD